MNKKYNIDIEVLTPTHIGDGNTLSGIDYFCFQEDLKPPFKTTSDGTEIKKESRLYKYHLSDLKDILDEKDIIDFNKYIEKSDIISLRNFLFDILNQAKYIKKFKDKVAYKKIKIKNSFYKNWRDKIQNIPKQQKGKTAGKRQAEFTNNLSQLNIQSFVNTKGNFYIPGSSLKGAIRTCLTNQNIEKSEAEKDPFKKLIVRDSEYFNNIEIGKLARQSNKGEGIYAEFLPIGSKLITTILIKNFINEPDLKEISLDKEYIINTINKFTKEKIKSYLENLEDLLNHNDLKIRNKGNIQKEEKINSIKGSLNSVLNQINTSGNNQCILNIGFGGGYWFKSYNGGEFHPNPNNIKHFKDTSNQIPRTSWNIDLESLGFIKLTFND